jgi:starch-binding outer membrane protein, SusD/RagB family
MKSKKIFYFIFLFLFFLNSCDKLEFGNDFLAKKDSGGDTTNEVIFGSLDMAKRYLTQGYTTLPYGISLTDGGREGLRLDVLECLTDLTHSFLSYGGAMTFYYNGNYTAGVESNSPSNTKYNYTGERNWEGIRIALNFINNIDKVPNVDPNVKKTLVAEAKMIIAVHYCDMYRHFGGLPWVDKIYSAADSPQLPRLTSLETLNRIVDLIDSAKGDLPDFIVNPVSDDGRFTKAAAMGLKARILLFGASPLFNNNNPYYDESKSLAIKNKLVWHGKEDVNLWQRAADAAKELLANLGPYKLVKTENGFRQDFQDAYYKRNNGEVLISTRVRNTGLDFWNANYIFYAAVINYGVANPTKNYVDMFPTDDGVPVYIDGKLNENNTRYDAKLPWANRDPRLYETVLVNGDKFGNGTVQLYPGGLNAAANNGVPLQRTGFKARKFLLDTDRNRTSVQGTVIHWPYLRLAEIYLSYAEALNEISGPTNEAIDAVNTVRARVGLGGLSNDQTKSKDTFREAILTERACEFGFEEVRWFDIVRHKRLDIFNKTLQGHYIASSNNGNEPFTYSVRDLPTRAWSRESTSITDPKAVHNFKWYLSAFPVNEVLKGYGLIQNPGW